VAVVVVSRWLAFPASIWDMDEANFTLGVLRFDPVHNQPHAPFFPLWIGLGKVVYRLLPEAGPARALQLVSVVFSVGVVFPLVSMWSAVLPRAEALAAAALYLFLPGVWLLAGRAYTEPAATALLITAVAAWLPVTGSRGRLAVGGFSLAAALLVRPQWLPVAAPLVIWRIMRCTGLKDRMAVAGVPAAVGAAAVAVVARHAGGIGPLWAAVEQHRAYMAGAARGFDWGYADLGIHAAAGGLVVGSLWLVVAAAGWAALIRGRPTRAGAGVLLGLALAPFVVLLLATQNPTLPRYALPIMALTAGAVVAGIRALVKSPEWTLGAVGVCVIGCVVVTAPALGTYRAEPSPVMAAFDHVATNPTIRALAVDRRLVAFVTLERARGRLRQQVVWDYQVELGMVESPFRRDLAALSTEPDPAWVTRPGHVVTFHCRRPLLRRIASPRFLDLTLIDGCALVRPENPSVRPEDLRPGAVIPAR
jgi:hypothetical protein